jgi:hypothetical protein
LRAARRPSHNRAPIAALAAARWPLTAPTTLPVANAAPERRRRHEPPLIGTHGTTVRCWCGPEASADRRRDGRCVIAKEPSAGRVMQKVRPVSLRGALHLGEHPEEPRPPQKSRMRHPGTYRWPMQCSASLTPNRRSNRISGPSTAPAATVGIALSAKRWHANSWNGSPATISIESSLPSYEI